MKFLIIGLGNFGSSLGIRLTELGHEVIGVDSSMEKVERYKNKISHTMCMDVTDLVSAQQLPYQQCDVVIVAIGEDFGASVLITAIFKQLKAKKIIARGISDIHITILEALQIDNIIMPEAEAASKLATALSMKGIMDSFELSEEYSIVEVKIPESFVGRTVKEVGLRSKYNLNIITIKRLKTEKNILGIVRKKGEILGVVAPDTRFEENDELIVFGKQKDIKKFLKINEIKE